MTPRSTRPNPESTILPLRTAEPASVTRKIGAERPLEKHGIEKHAGVLSNAVLINQQALENKLKNREWYQTEIAVYTRIAADSLQEANADETPWYTSERRRIGAEKKKAITERAQKNPEEAPTHSFSPEETGRDEAYVYLRQLELELREIEEDLARLERQSKNLERVRSRITEGETDESWYREEERKQDLRQMVTQGLARIPLSEANIPGAESQRCAILFAAYLNEDILCEYSLDHKKKLRAGVDHALENLPTDLIPRVKEFLHWDVVQGYLSVPPKKGRRVVATPPPTSSIKAPPILIKIWKEVAAEAATVDLDRTAPLARAKGPDQIRKLEPGQREYRTAESLFNALQEGDTLIIEGFTIGKAVRCRAPNVKNIREVNGRINLDTDALTADGQSVPAAYQISIALTSSDSVIVRSLSIDTRRENMYFLAPRFILESRKAG